MLEILFSDSAAGAFRIAQGYGKEKSFGGACSVLIQHADPRKLRRARQAAEARMRQQEQNAIPLGTGRQDICVFPLALSMGDIQENGVAPARLQTLRRLFGCFPEEGAEAAAELYARAQESLAMLLERAAAGEALRIWYSNQPDELCGLHWLMAQLPLPLAGDIALIRLPEWEELDAQHAVQHWNGWGEIEPARFGHYLSLQQPASPLFCRSCAQRWRELQSENSPLRACVNGRLTSVDETFYDVLIRRVLAKQDTVFQEARLIGHILGAEPLGLSDGWLALRIESMIAAGELIPESTPSDGDPAYHRMLRKAAKS